MQQVTFVLHTKSKTHEFISINESCIAENKIVMLLMHQMSELYLGFIACVNAPTTFLIARTIKHQGERLNYCQLFM